MHTYIRVCVCVRACARIYTCIHIYIYICTIHLHSPSTHAQTGAGRASPRAALRSHRHALSHSRVPCTRDDKASYATLQLSSDECSSPPAQQGGQGRAGPPLPCSTCAAAASPFKRKCHPYTPRGAAAGPAVGPDAAPAGVARPRTRRVGGRGGAR